IFAWFANTFQHQGIDVCINNAGLALPAPLLSGKTSGWRTMMDVHTSQNKYSMKERKVDDGQIININGMCGHRVLHNADLHFCNATKYAVTALTEGLRQELREAKTHIRATSVSPGLVETELTYRLLSQNPKKAAATYLSIKCLQAAEIANTVVYVLSAPPHVQKSRVTPIEY
uniref:Dehydrogenase/reductase SDR family member 11 n=1 Tax=Cyprinus carpio TaxID=7962 RepID=A0A8C1MYJ7_CYPCA